MTSASNLWGRVQEEIRTVTERTRRGAERAVRTGVLRVDLVSHRRDRNRAHADLGERVLALWSEGRLESLAEDSEMLRLRELVRSIDRSIAAKEEELELLRARDPEPVPGH